MGINRGLIHIVKCVQVGYFVVDPYKKLNFAHKGAVVCE